ncbi:MAG: hypothetical protein KF910_01530 [Brevundimonas sp.]|uniref:hypothetical protein n=1 Tax=Brevundimonas sp. TaxID=1871086 RepID=UPI0025C086A8|nr:hypothetical protein [Brevundimonas sp.]MBX3476264.1 hypothetical protein [Brevundimonas sp.]
MRSLAFLAAVFAVVFASLLPAAVAASPATGAPIVLCSGGRLITAFDQAGQAHHQPGEKAATSLDCAAALLSGLSAVDTPAPPLPLAPIRTSAPAPAFAPRTAATVPSPAPRPPSTAPPIL